MEKRSTGAVRLNCISERTEIPYANSNILPVWKERKPLASHFSLWSFELHTSLAGKSGHAYCIINKPAHMHLFISMRKQSQIFHKTKNQKHETANTE